KLDILVRRMPDPTMPMFGQIYAAVAQGAMLDEAGKAAKLEAAKKALEGREPLYEREMIKYFLKQFDALPSDQKFEGAENLFGTFEGSARRAAEEAFATNIAMGDYWSPETIAAQYGPQTMDFRPERDQPKAFAAALKKAKD